MFCSENTTGSRIPTVGKVLLFKRAEKKKEGMKKIRKRKE